jgi:ABC-type lipoprotein export system ATPase subunit
MSDSIPLLQVIGLDRQFQEGDRVLHILRGVDMTVAKGEWVSILGRSGSGKSTLMHLVAGIDRATSGQIIFDGQCITALSGAALDGYRNRKMGLVFQSYHLLPELSALDNVMVAGMMEGSAFSWLGKRKSIKARAQILLTRVGLGERMHHKPAKLSGGERQRVAIARALINNPALILADEPTGNLDAQTAEEILALFGELQKEGHTLVLVTHDDKVAAKGNRVVTLKDGQVV